MKKMLFLAAIIAASVISPANAAAKSTDALSVNVTTDVSATAEYDGEAYDLVMAGRPIPGSYPAKFDIDEDTGDITGSFRVEPMIHDFYLVGNLYDGTATGYVILADGTRYDYDGELYDVSFDGDCVTFTCYAWIPALQTYSQFTFTGCK
jgi:hypothetical protein